MENIATISMVSQRLLMDEPESVCVTFYLATFFLYWKYGHCNCKEWFAVFFRRLFICLDFGTV